MNSRANTRERKLTEIKDVKIGSGDGETNALQGDIRACYGSKWMIDLDLF